ncbi:MAG: four-carbon acid sugar kinase family protein [Limisphaerales bacterium]
MSRLLLTFYGDDFTGSTDALEQLTRFGIRTALFIEPPTPEQLRRFPGLQAIGVAGMTRSMKPAALRRTLFSALKRLKALGARHVHYKVCSTFDSSPETGSIGAALDVAARVFDGPFVPMLVGAPALGRYCLFGNLFARFGIGTDGDIHRLDRHPSVSRHPVTPMTESDLRRHLARQTRKKIALFDILKVALPESERRAVLKRILADKPDVVLFDALFPEDLQRVGALIDAHGRAGRPLFSVGSSAIEAALGGLWRERNVPPGAASLPAGPTDQILVGSGSRSPVTERQIALALKRGFAEVALDPSALATKAKSDEEIKRATDLSVGFLRRRRSVIVHTTGRASGRPASAHFRGGMASVLGASLGRVLRGAQAQSPVRRLCIAGGDTSGHVARALGIQTLEMIAPLTPGAPLSRAFAPASPVDGCEIVFKGGQVGAENYFESVQRGRI